MSKERSASLGELATAIGGTVVGDSATRISGVSMLKSGVPGTISFLSDPRHKRYLLNTGASAVILRAGDADECPVAAVIVDNPHLAFVQALRLLKPRTGEEAGVHSTAWIHPDAHVGADVAIGPHVSVGAGCRIGNRVHLGAGCRVGRDVVIGDDAWLHPQVTVNDRVRLGARVEIQSGAVIGSDGFGYANSGGAWEKVPQVGTVVIGNDVEIGANTAIDRGALADTVIEDGVKIDNLVHIAHNVRIGAHSAIAGCVGIAGSTTIGRGCSVGGQTAINGYIEIADNVHVTGMSMVTRNITEAGVYSSGIPLDSNRRWKRNAVRFQQLDDIARRVAALEKASPGKKQPPRGDT